MIISFTYRGTGIAQIKNGDILKYDTEHRPFPGDLIVANVGGDMRVIRYHSRMRKKKDGFELIGVITFT